MVLKYFPNANKKVIEFILWEFTGFPHFFHNDIMTELESQIKTIKDHFPDWDGSEDADTMYKVSKKFDPEFYDGV